MAALADSPWDNSTKLAIGRALAETDDDQGLTASQLAEVIGKHQSNLKKLAEELIGAGVLELAKPPQPNGQPGRRARDAFAFVAGGRERFEALIEDDRPDQDPDVGTHLVIVDAVEQAGTLSKILSQASAVGGVDKALHLEGDGTELMFMFRGPTAVNDSLDLLAVLKDAELKAQRRSVSKSSSGREVRQAARRQRQRVERSREQLGSMQTSPRPTP